MADAPAAPAAPDAPDAAGGEALSKNEQKRRAKAAEKEAEKACVHYIRTRARHGRVALCTRARASALLIHY